MADKVDLVGKEVKHRIFGKGIITECEIPYFFVEFHKYNKKSKFAYPDAFKDILSTEDVDLVDKIERDLDIKEKIELKKELDTQKAIKIEKSKRRWDELDIKNKNSNDFIRKIRPFKDFQSFVTHSKDSLNSEIYYLKSNGGKKYRIIDGKFLEERKGMYIYSFETETEFNFLDGIQITIFLSEGERIPGQIVCCDDNSIILESSTYIGKKKSYLEFSAESWVLLNYLITRLNEIQEGKVSKIVENLVCNGRKKVQYGEPFIKGQQNACKMACSQPITFIWGPPGTGKTETLAEIALKHLKEGNRVLMLSYSNVSVDGAALRVLSKCKEIRPGEVIRYGYPKDKKVLDNKYLSSYKLAISKCPKLMIENKKLNDELGKINIDEKSTQRYIEIKRQIKNIKKELSDVEKGCVRSANFVATTVSKAIVDKVIYDADFDVVIFDEASMAYLPQIIFSASLAKKHFICMGDFAQLPPIVQGGRESDLNIDIFRYCGIVDAVESQNGHEWLCVLDKQYRMHPEIAEFTNKVMYHNILSSADYMAEKRENIVNNGVFSGIPIAIADLSGMMSTCTSTVDASRINPLSAFISVGMAMKTAENNEVGIVVPYQAQARLINAMIRDIASSSSDLKKITCATVHQFQGSEKDVIVFDSVDCYRQPYPGTLLTRATNDYANRLFNVALTRAKGKFIGVVNVDYMRRKNLSPKLMLTKLLDEYDKPTYKVKGEKLVSKLYIISGGKSCLQFYDKKRGTDEFIKDIRNAEDEICIDIPGGIDGDNKYIDCVALELEKAKKRDVKVKIRTDSDINVPSRLAPFLGVNDYIANAMTVIDKKVSWFGEPLSDANFKVEGQVLKTEYRPIIRFEGHYTAASLYGFLEMDKNASTINHFNEKRHEKFNQYVKNNVKCCMCGKQMVLRHKKTFFLGCSGYPSCVHTEMITVDFVEKYLSSLEERERHCRHCNAILRARNGRFGVYIQCEGPAGHRYSLDEI